MQGLLGLRGGDLSTLRKGGDFEASGRLRGGGRKRPATADEAGEENVVAGQSGRCSVRSVQGNTRRVTLTLVGKYSRKGGEVLP